MTDKWIPEAGQACEARLAGAWRTVLPIFIGTTCIVYIHDGVERVARENSFNGMFRPIQTEADKYRDEQIVELFNIFSGAYNEAHKAGTLLYEQGCRVLAPDERIVKPLTDAQRALARSIGRNASVPYVIHNDTIEKVIDAVQRELGVID